MKTGLYHREKTSFTYEICKWILTLAFLANLYQVNARTFLSLPLKLGSSHDEGEGRYRRSDQFQSQRNNLKGKPGQGYYVEMDIGTPPQRVSYLSKECFLKMGIKFVD